MNLKSKESQLRIGEKKGEFVYILSPELYSKLDADKVFNQASLHSGISKGAIKAAWYACGEVIKSWVTEGHSVELPGIGTMRFGVRSKAVNSVDEVSSNLITSRRVVFTPSKEIKNELKNTPIHITCYDRNGNKVKSSVSSDESNIE